MCETQIHGSAQCLSMQPRRASRDNMRNSLRCPRPAALPPSGSMLSSGLCCRAPVA